MTEVKQENTEQKMKFEEALAKLEQIVQQLETGALPLEESLAQFEEGMRLSKICGDKLAEVEGKIEVLVKRPDGNLAWGDYQQQPPVVSQNGYPQR